MELDAPNPVELVSAAYDELAIEVNESLVITEDDYEPLSMQRPSKMVN